jgi:arsenate reductase (glutaredoxin)
MPRSFQERSMKVYGIKNCDTVKKARAWLDSNGIVYEFVDLKKTPPTTDEIARWCDALGVNVVLNRRGTTWKKLTDSEQASADSIRGAIALMVAHPSAIKRPVIEIGSKFLIGFDNEAYQAQFL